MLEGVAFAAVAFFRHGKRRSLAIVATLLLFGFVAAFLLPTAAMATCTQPIPDKVVAPLPANVTVVRDEQRSSGWIHDAPWLRTQVLRSTNERWDAFAARVAKHFDDQGWQIQAATHEQLGKHTYFALAGNWSHDPGRRGQ